MKRIAGLTIPWEDVFYALDDLIYVIKPDYSITSLNKKAMNFFALNSNYLPDKKCHQIFFNKETPCEHCPIKDGTVFSQACTVETPILLKEEFFKLRMHPIFDTNGDTYQFIVFLQDITEEISVKRSKHVDEIYRQLIENSQDVYIIIDENLKFRYVSPSVEQLLGYSASEFLKHSMEQVLTPESYKQIRALYAKDKSLGKIVNDYQIIKKDKSLGWVEMAITPIRNSQNQITGYISQTKDVNEKKAAVDALKISEKRYNLVQDHAGIRISYFTPEGNVIFMNRTSARKLGGVPEDFVGRNYIDFFDSELSTVFSHHFENTLKSHFPIDFEDEFQLEGGKLFLLTTFSRITNSSGENEGVLVVIKDITELKLAEEEIKRNASKLQSLLEISQLDNLDHIEILNHALEEALKFTQSKMGFLFHYDENEKVFSLDCWSKSVDQRIIKSEKKHCKLEKSGIWADAVKQRKPILVNNHQERIAGKKDILIGESKLNKYLHVPIFWNKEIVALIGLANKQDDYTENDTQQIQLLMNTVWKIIERNKAEAELIIAKEKAEESDRLKSSFLANMSHEIRTPINGIMGLLSLIKSSDLKAETSDEYYHLIERNFDHLLKLISDIIDISRLESNEICLSKSTVDVSKLIQEVVEAANNELKLLQKENVTIHIECKDKKNANPFIEADEIRLRQVLTNLVNNSLKFTEDGEIRIGCKLKQDEKLIEFFVHDTGIGISKTQQKIIFERFRQVDETLTRRFGGTGIGLSISKHLVDLMGGKIWVKSKINKYTTFYFTLPYSPSTLEDIEIPDTHEMAATNWEGKLFLIIEDDDSNFLFLSETLKSSGAKIIRSSTFEEAIQALSEHSSIDLILLDVRLPDGNGLDLIPTIRERFKKTPIIAQTSHALDDDRKKHIDAGCNDYIAKPIHIELLTKIINKQFQAIFDEKTTEGSGTQSFQE